LLDDNHSGLPAASSEPFLLRLFAQGERAVHRRGARFGRGQPVRRCRRTVFPERPRCFRPAASCAS